MNVKEVKEAIKNGKRVIYKELSLVTKGITKR